MQPLANWDNHDSQHPDLLWWNRLDGKWQCEVQRVDDREAMLIIFDHADNTPIYQESVSLAYGAMFGPDVMDVEFWKERCCNVVDDLARGED
jgi:hypothetical protein